MDWILPLPPESFNGATAMPANFTAPAVSVLESTYRNHQCLLTRSETGWAVWVAGSPILFDLESPNFTPAYSWVDLKLAMAGNGMPPSKGKIPCYRAR